MILLISSLTWLLISVFQADQFLSTEPELPGCINCFCSGLTIICFLFRRRLSMQCFNFPIPFLKIILIPGIPTGSRPTPCRASHLHRDQVHFSRTASLEIIIIFITDPCCVPRLCPWVHPGRLLPGANHRSRPACSQLHFTGNHCIDH